MHTAFATTAFRTSVCARARRRRCASLTSVPLPASQSSRTTGD